MVYNRFLRRKLLTTGQGMESTHIVEMGELNVQRNRHGTRRRLHRHRDDLRVQDCGVSEWENTRKNQSDYYNGTRDKMHKVVTFKGESENFTNNKIGVRSQTKINLNGDFLWDKLWPQTKILTHLENGLIISNNLLYQSTDLLYDR